MALLRGMLVGVGSAQSHVERKNMKTVLISTLLLVFVVGFLPSCSTYWPDSAERMVLQQSADGGELARAIVSSRRARNVCQFIQVLTIAAEAALYGLALANNDDDMMMAGHVALAAGLVTAIPGVIFSIRTNDLKREFIEYNRPGTSGAFLLDPRGGIIAVGERRKKKDPIKSLIADLYDEDVVVRRDAVRELARKGALAAKAIPHLVRMTTDDSHPGVRDYAEKALKLIRKKIKEDQTTQACHQQKIDGENTQGLNCWKNWPGGTQK